MRNDPLCSCQYVVSVLTVSHVWYKLACQGLLVVACVCPQQTLVQARQTVVAQALRFVLCSVVTEAVFYVVVLLVTRFSGGVLCGAGLGCVCGPLHDPRLTTICNHS